ncbi:hypothetical protein GH714_038113 [Hevea brasiliensis]|uniref:Uncharacterized protein n=1 Tax=Hevea brasiliensis TaxID=3981 RepID=A0A6A6LXD6_HEVBR|nr:hypothetical protein GH714_038113 [Hevea brasiliensis]
MEAMQNYPRHVPVHVLRELGEHACKLPIRCVIPGNQPEKFMGIPICTYIQLHPLLEHQTAHAAASFAATFWPYANVGSSADSLPCAQGGFPSRQMNFAPSMAAIAAATVAAATAWWAAHGLLPLCAPLHASFTCPPPATAVPSMDAGQVPAGKTERKETTLENPPLQDQQLDLEHSEALQSQNSASKDSGCTKQNIVSKATDREMAATAPEIHDLSKLKNRKQVDRSSCGSNTSSSGEVETDALEKLEKERKSQTKLIQIIQLPSLVAVEVEVVAT